MDFAPRSNGEPRAGTNTPRALWPRNSAVLLGWHADPTRSRRGRYVLRRAGIPQCVVPHTRQWSRLDKMVVYCGPPGFGVGLASAIYSDPLVVGAVRQSIVSDGCGRRRPDRIRSRIAAHPGFSHRLAEMALDLKPNEFHFSAPSSIRDRARDSGSHSSSGLFRVPQLMFGQARSSGMARRHCHLLLAQRSDVWAGGRSPGPNRRSHGAARSGDDSDVGDSLSRVFSRYLNLSPAKVPARAAFSRHNFSLGNRDHDGARELCIRYVGGTSFGALAQWQSDRTHHNVDPFEAKKATRDAA